MINLIETPQRNDFLRAKYTVNDDMLTVKIDNVEEVFDFTELEEGAVEEIIDDGLTVTVIRFYGKDEKKLFEN